MQSESHTSLLNHEAFRDSLMVVPETEPQHPTVLSLGAPSPGRTFAQSVERRTR
jgi:hypothetical protein